MKKIIAIILLVMCVFFCNAQSDTNKLKNDVSKNSLSVDKTDTSKYAVLFVYRPKNFVGSMIGYDLKVFDSASVEKIVGRVKNNSKFVIKLYKEGKTEIWAKTEVKSSVVVNIEYGKQYYLKCDIRMGAMVGRPELKLVDPEHGELEYRKVKKR